jgi:membrane protein
VKRLFEIIKQTFIEFFQEQSFFHGAALAYYTVFAMIPLIYLAIVCFGVIVGQDTVSDIIEDVLHKQIGLQDVSGIMTFLKDLNVGEGTFLSNTVGIVTLMFSSSVLLSSLRTSINEFYDVQVTIESRRKRFEYHIGTKLVSMFMLAVFGVVFITLYIGETFIMSAISGLLGDLSSFEEFIISSLLNIFSVLTNVVLFAMVLKYVNDGQVKWRYALKGALFTSLLLFLGQLLIKFYLKNFFFGSKAGVAGTLLVILLWMYYTSQIIFLGAKFTKVVAIFDGNPIQFVGRRITPRRVLGRVKGERKNL